MSWDGSLHRGFKDLVSLKSKQCRGNSKHDKVRKCKYRKES